MKPTRRLTSPRRNFVAIAAALATFAGAQAAPLPAPSPTQLSPRLPARDRPFDGAVAVDAQGNSVAVWNANGVVQAAAQTRGSPYCTAVNVSSADEVASEPRIALTPDGGAIAIWAARARSGDHLTGDAIHVAIKPVGEDWRSPFTLASSANEVTGSPRIAVDLLGHATAVWRACDAQSCTIRSSVRSADGAWSVAVDLSDAGRQAMAPQLAMNPYGVAAVTWQMKVGSSDLSVVQAAVRQPGKDWARPVDVSGAAASFGAKSAVDGRGRVTMVWNEAGGIRVATRDESGAWKAPRLLSAPGVASRGAPDVAADLQGNTVVAWAAPDPKHASVSVVQVARQGADGTWSAPMRVSGKGEDAGEPRVAVASGGGVEVVGWVDMAHGGARMAKRTARGWQPPVTLGGALTDGTVETSAAAGGQMRGLWGMTATGARDWVAAVAPTAR